MQGFLTIFMTLTFLSFRALTAEIIEDFSTRERLAPSSTAVWNQALGKVHPSLQVVNYKTGYTTPLDFSVGDGSHGAFELSTYAQFSVDGDISGNTIRLDLSKFPILKVTRFHLQDGWILEPVGSSALVIQSLSTVVIDGQIWCQGRHGSQALGSTPGIGGVGRCGGGKGGDGGGVNSNAQNGEAVHASVTGGMGGKSTGGAAVGGGGGGSWNTSALPSSGANSTASDGGLAGNSLNDPEFTIDAGGAGGGGGSGTLTAAGGGGGAGGGFVAIYAVDDIIFGLNGIIQASGGNGGTSNSGGGIGGGGAGGSVKVFSGGTIDISSSNFASEASAGTGGGAGGKGRSWMASVGFIYDNNTYDPPEESPLTPNTQTIAFASAPQFVETKSLDLESTLPILESLTVNPTSGDFLLEAQGSSDNFILNETPWSTNLASISNKRYVKLRLTLTNSTPFAPTMADLIQLQFSRQTRNQFEFKNSGCGSLGPSQFPFWGLILFILPLFLALGLQRLKTHPVEQNPIHKT